MNNDWVIQLSGGNTGQNSVWSSSLGFVSLGSQTQKIDICNRNK